MIVEQAVKMAKSMNVPILGLVETMSYFECPDNGKKYEIFGKSHVDEIASENGLKVLAKLPINPDLATLSDQGRIEFADTTALDESIMQMLHDIEK